MQARKVIKQAPSFKKPDLIDLDVLRRIKEGDGNAFGIIMEKYYNSIYLRVTKFVINNEEERKDVIQDIFVRVYENVGKYKKEYTFNSWLSKVTDNYLIDYHRKCKITAGYHANGTSLNSLVINEDGNEGTVESNITLLPVVNHKMVICDGADVVQKRENKQIVDNVLNVMKDHDKNQYKNKVDFFRNKLIRLSDEKEVLITRLIESKLMKYTDQYMILLDEITKIERRMDKILIEMNNVKYRENMKKYHRILSMVYVEDKSYRTICKELNLNLSTVKIMLFRAKENFQRFMLQEHPYFDYTT